MRRLGKEVRSRMEYLLGIDSPLFWNIYFK